MHLEPDTPTLPYSNALFYAIGQTSEFLLGAMRFPLSCAKKASLILWRTSYMLMSGSKRCSFVLAVTRSPWDSAIIASSLDMLLKRGPTTSVKSFAQRSRASVVGALCTANRWMMHRLSSIGNCHNLET